MKESEWVLQNRFETLLDRVKYLDHRWRTGPMGDGAYLQIAYVERCVDSGELREQTGRKWYVSQHATDSEILQTALKAALTSAEHRVREHFLVDGVRAFGPHLDVDELIAFARERGESRRK